MKEYFSHDHHARTDEKIIKMLKTSGVEGYGLYWMIVEMLHENQGSIPKDYELLAYELRTQCERIKAVCEDYDLFYERDGRILSLSVDRRLQERAEKSVKAKSSAMKRWGGNANAMRTQCDLDAKAGVLKERKGKERKEGGGEADPPTLSQVRDYREAEHLKADPDKFHAWQSSKGWAGVIDWKAAFRYWDRTEYPDKSTQLPVLPKINPADIHKENMDSIDHANAWHDKHMAGGKCSFCKTKAVGLATCKCKAYTDGFNKHMEKSKT